MTYSPRFRGSSANASSRQTKSGYQNGTGSTLAQGTPVATDATGQLINVDPANESTVLSIVGLAAADIPSAASGEVVDAGRLEKITTSFAIGDAIYVGKTGNLINTKPSLGSYGFVSGDFVIFVGVIVKNEFDVSAKDIKLMLSVIGQL